MCQITQLLNRKKLNNMAVAWRQRCFEGTTAQLQWKVWYTLMANTLDKLREWKQSLKAFNSCRQAQSIIVLWSCVWWEEHHWELNAIIICKCHGRRLHIVKLFHLKYNMYESHRFFIIIQVDTIDHYIIEIKSKCYLWRTRRCLDERELPVMFISLFAKSCSWETPVVTNNANPTIS